MSYSSTIYVYCTTFSTVIRTFLGEGGGALIGRWALIKYCYPWEERLFEGGHLFEAGG